MPYIVETVGGSQWFVEQGVLRATSSRDRIYTPPSPHLTLAPTEGYDRVRRGNAIHLGWHAQCRESNYVPDFLT